MAGDSAADPRQLRQRFAVVSDEIAPADRLFQSVTQTLVYVSNNHPVVWTRVAVPATRVSRVLVHASSGTWDTDVYVSADVNEDGSTLTLRRSIRLYADSSPSGASTAFFPEGNDDGVPYERIAWIYIRLTHVAGANGFPEFEFTYEAAGPTTVTHNGAMTSYALGSVVHGRGGARLRSFDPIAGHGTMDIRRRTAADELADAQDISAGGTVLEDASGWPWGPPITASPGETPLAYYIAQYDATVTRERTVWHKFYMPEPGTMRFYDDPGVTGGVTTPGFGTHGGTFLAAYSGPADAGYDDLEHIVTGVGQQSTVTGEYGNVDIDVEVAEAGWIYLQHAYVGDYGSTSDVDHAPTQMFCFGGTRPDPPDDVTFDPIAGRTSVRLLPFLLDTIAGQGTLTVTPDVEYPAEPEFDVITGTSTVTYNPTGTEDIFGAPDVAAGFSTMALRYVPEMGDNPPIQLRLRLSGEISVELDDTGPSVAPRRSNPIVTVTTPPMIVVNGIPVVPDLIGQIATSADVLVGPGHIRAEKPAPQWDGSGYVLPPPHTSKAMAGRWVVDDLPSPGDGYYWLGEASAKDGTGNIGKKKRLWAPHDSTPHAPAWRSHYPFKPSVRAANHFLPGGRQVHHPIGVHMNPEYIEHMWLDFGGSRPQPFTWVIAAMVVSFAGKHYRHYVLDAGRDPDKVKFPRINDYQTGDDRKIRDNLDYRTLLAINDEHMIMTARNDEFSARTLRTPAYGSIVPRMMYGVFAGGKSRVGHHSPNGDSHRAGRIDNGKNQRHRYYVLGRKQGIMSQDKAAHLLVFEIRYWRYALTPAELNDQYKQLASTYKFNKYRRI